MNPYSGPNVAATRLYRENVRPRSCQSLSAIYHICAQLLKMPDKHSMFHFGLAMLELQLRWQLQDRRTSSRTSAWMWACNAHPLPNQEGPLESRHVDSTSKWKHGGDSWHHATQKGRSPLPRGDDVPRAQHKGHILVWRQARAHLHQRTGAHVVGDLRDALEASASGLIQASLTSLSTMLPKSCNLNTVVANQGVQFEQFCIACAVQANDRIAPHWPFLEATLSCIAQLCDEFAAFDDRNVKLTQSNSTADSILLAASNTVS